MSYTKSKSQDNINAVDEFDTFTFVEGDEAIIPVGKCIAEFNFEDLDLSSTIIKNKTDTISRKSSSAKIIDNTSNKNTFTLDNIYIPTCHGAIPSIDDELPDTKRCYVLRSSTVRKINEIKNNHSSLNVCVSTIVDLAVSHYYDCIKNNN